MQSKINTWTRRSLVWMMQLPWWAVGIVLFALFFLRGFFIYDPDFGWHLATGEYIRAHGVPSHDIYTYTASSFPWVNHEWLADVFTSYVYDIGGFLLLALLHAALWTAAFVAIAWGIRYRALVVLAAVIALPFAGVRSATASVACSVGLILLMRSRRLYWLVVPLMLLWANIHGSFVLGLAYIAFETVRRYRRSKGRILVAIASLVVVFINPYVWNVYVEVWRTMTDSSLGSRISEWQSWQVDPLFGAYVGIWGLALVFGSKRWTDAIRFDTLLFFMSLMSGRHIPLFVVFSLAELVRFRMVRKIDFEELWQHVGIRISFILLSLVALGGLVMTGLQYVSWPPAPAAGYAPQAVSYLREHPCSGNVFNNYNFGGYMIWKLPGVPVYIDGRMPSWSHDNQKYMDRYLAVIDDSNVRKEEFARYNVRCVIWYDNKFAKDLEADGWQRMPIGSDRFVLLEKS